jgi:hypothetical protein
MLADCSSTVLMVPPQDDDSDRPKRRPRNRRSIWRLRDTAEARLCWTAFHAAASKLGLDRRAAMKRALELLIAESERTRGDDDK